MQEYDYMRLLNRLRVHLATTREMVATTSDENDDYYKGKLAGLDEAYTTMTSMDKATSRQEHDCPYCHEKYPLVDYRGASLKIVGSNLELMGDFENEPKNISVWYCPMCGRRIKKFPDEKELPE